MNTTSRIEPLAFHFDAGCVKHDVLKHSPVQAKRAKRKAERNQSINLPVSRRAAAAVAADGGGGGGGEGGGKRERKSGDGEDLPVVHIYTARWLRTRAITPPLPFRSLLTVFSHILGSTSMAPAQTEPVQTTPALDTDTPELPPNTKLSYLAEGGANVVYKITLPEDLSPDISRRFDGKLLRLRKLIDSSMPYIETIRNFDTHVRKLFDSHELVDQELIRLPKNFIACCNDQLRLDEAQSKRPQSRHGVYLSTKEPFGLLITDMTPAPDSGDCLWEFKPKWLLQSPSAPSNAKRCRTCALRDMKNHDAWIEGRRESRSFCPLDLISDDFEDVVRATSFIKGAHSRSRVAKFLHRNSTLLRIQAQQQRLNAVGLPGLDAPYLPRALSMTLRDCTMYVKVPANEGAPLEVRLGDLDFKSGIGGKLQYWRGIETRLIDEGWYSGTRESQERTECPLQRLPQRDDAPFVSSTSNGTCSAKYDI